MSVLPPVLLGISSKFYDDLIDKQIHIPSYALHGLEILLLILLVLTLEGEFYLSLVMGVISLLTPGFDTPFWSLFAVVSFGMMIRNRTHAGVNLWRNITLLLLPLGLFLIAALFEDRLFKEEVSFQKILFRVLFLFGAGAFLWIPYQEWLSIPKELHSMIHRFILLLVSSAAYSVITMSYLVLKK